jgi:hypothetical protein
MQFEIVKLDSLSGDSAGIYTILLEGETFTLFEKFLNENVALFKSEISDILQRLNTIANKTGARESFFKTKEGRPGDGVCALYDIPGSKLRLYCIRFGQELIILGGGGPKPKSIRALQEDNKLKDENFQLREIAKRIMLAQKEKELWFSKNFLDFEGNLSFEENE